MWLRDLDPRRDRPGLYSSGLAERAGVLVFPGEDRRTSRPRELIRWEDTQDWMRPSMPRSC